MDEAALAAIGLVIAALGGLIAWLVRERWARRAGVILLVVAVALEVVAVTGSSKGGAQADETPSPFPISSTPASSPTAPPTTGSSSSNLPTSIHHELLAVIRFHENLSSGRLPRELNTEYVALENHGADPVDLVGWTLTSSSGAVYHFPAITLSLNETVKVHTGTGTNGPEDLYWGQPGFVWNNVSDTATLRGPQGGLQDVCSYRNQPGDAFQFTC